MTQSKKTGAVGAGTNAGDAASDERGCESRAAQAVEDAQLESVRTTGAAPTGVRPGNDSAHPTSDDSRSPDTAPSAQQPGAPPRPRHDYGEHPREDLANNQAGVGSRLKD